MRLRRLVGLIALAYAAGVASLLFWPDGERVRRVLLDVYLYGLQHLGIPPSVTPDDYAVAANALLLLPLALVGVIFVGRRWAWGVLVLGVLVGFAVEYLQGALGLARVADLSDALLNAAGGVVGAVIGWAVDFLLDRRVARRPEHPD